MAKKQGNYVQYFRYSNKTTSPPSPLIRFAYKKDWLTQHVIYSIGRWTLSYTVGRVQISTIFLKGYLAEDTEERRF